MGVTLNHLAHDAREKGNPETPEAIPFDMKPDDSLAAAIRARLPNAEIPRTPTDSEIIDWLQNMHNLHTTVEALYVVDGYEVSLCWDSVPVHQFKAETLREAYCAAMSAFPHYAGRQFVPAVPESTK